MLNPTSLKFLGNKFPAGQFPASSPTMALSVTLASVQHCLNVPAGSPFLTHCPPAVDHTVYFADGTTLLVKVMLNGWRGFAGTTPTRIVFFIGRFVTTVT